MAANLSAIARVTELRKLRGGCRNSQPEGANVEHFQFIECRRCVATLAQRCGPNMRMICRTFCFSVEDSGHIHG
jgi:hypothetical protein